MREQTVPVQELAAVLWRRRKIVAVIFGAGVLAAIVLAWIQAPAYRAAATLRLTSARATIALSPDANERPRVDPVTEADLGSEVALLRSTSLLREVLAPHQARLETTPPMGGITAWATALVRLPGRVYRAIHDVPPPSALDLWVEDTARHLSVEPIGRSNLIEVELESREPVWAAQLVNELVSHHVGRHVRMNQQVSTQQFFESQRALLSDRLSEAEAALREFYRREGIETTATALPALRTRVTKLEAALADAETSLAEATAEAGFLGDAMRAMPRDSGVIAAAGASPTSATALVKARLVELELQRSQLLAQYAPNSMRVGDVDRQIAEARRLLDRERRTAGAAADPTRQALESTLTQTRARAAALEARTASLREQLDAHRRDLGRLSGVASEQERLEREVSTAKQSLSTYLKKAEEARFSNALDESRIVNVAVVEPATVPETPQPSKRLTTMLLGMLVSLAAALGVAFIRDRLDPTLKSAAEAERVTGLPVLAELTT